MLDAILSPQWDLRFYSFDHQWNENSMMASMRDGSGDHLFMLFNASGAIIKGFAHESPMSPFHARPPRVWRGVLDDVPAEFANFLSEPAFSIEETTFCLWRLEAQSHWQRGDTEFPDDENPDGSRDLLLMFDGQAQTYRDWAQDYYEQPVDLRVVSLVYKHHPLWDDMVRKLNPELTSAALTKDAQEISYPDLQRFD